MTPSDREALQALPDEQVDIAFELTERAYEENDYIAVSRDWFEAGARWALANRAALPSAQAAPPSDPMDWPLPCDVTVGGGTMCKGVKLRTLVARMEMLHREAFPDHYTLTDNEKAANLARLQAPAAAQAPENSNANRPAHEVQEAPDTGMPRVQGDGQEEVHREVHRETAWTRERSAHAALVRCEALTGPAAAQAPAETVRELMALARDYASKTSDTIYAVGSGSYRERYEAEMLACAALESALTAALAAPSRAEQVAVVDGVGFMLTGPSSTNDPARSLIRWLGVTTFLPGTPLYAAPPPAERAAGPRTLPPLDGLASAWDWFVTDHQNGGHRSDCPDEHGCHCGFDNLRCVIESLAAAPLSSPEAP